MHLANFGKSRNFFLEHSHYSLLLNTILANLHTIDNKTITIKLFDNETYNNILGFVRTGKTAVLWNNVFLYSYILNIIYSCAG